MSYFSLWFPLFTFYLFSRRLYIYLIFFPCIFVFMSTHFLFDHSSPSFTFFLLHFSGYFLFLIFSDAFSLPPSHLLSSFPLTYFPTDIFLSIYVPCSLYITYFFPYFIPYTFLPFIPYLSSFTSLCLVFCLPSLPFLFPPFTPEVYAMISGRIQEASWFSSY